MIGLVIALAVVVGTLSMVVRDLSRRLDRVEQDAAERLERLATLEGFVAGLDMALGGHEEPTTPAGPPDPLDESAALLEAAYARRGRVP